MALEPGLRSGALAGVAGFGRCPGCPRLGADGTRVVSIFR